MALIDNIVSYYKLDDTGDAYDELEANELTNGNSVATEQAGKIGTSYDFSGATNMYLEKASPTGLTGVDLSCSMWVNIVDSDDVDVIISIFDASPDTIFRLDFTGSTTNMTIQVYDGGYEPFATDFTAYFGKWTHIAWSCTATDLKLYLDGVLKIDESITFTRFSGVDALTVGNADSRDRTWSVNGKIDELGIWAREFIQDDVDELYNSGAGFAYPFVAAGTNMEINVGDVWKDVDSLQINIGDVWKNVTKVELNIGDVWKTIFG